MRMNWLERHNCCETFSKGGDGTFVGRFFGVHSWNTHVAPQFQLVAGGVRS